MGDQVLHNVTATFTPAPPLPSLAAAATTTAGITASRKIGFRTINLVTGNDTDPSFVSAGGDGSANMTMLLRVNGAAVFARGSNHVPLEELEGRASAEASRRTMLSAAEGGMNAVRLWAGGIYEYDAWYDAADEVGIMILHDMMFIEQGHGPCCPFYACASGWSCHDHPNVKKNSSAALDCSCETEQADTQRREIRHQMRRLSHHPSIAVWEACNECGGFGLYQDFVMEVVAAEDQSRPIWPSSPSNGWVSGVDRVTGLPNGKPLVASAGKTTSPTASLPCTACQCTLDGCSVADHHGPYQGGDGFCHVTMNNGTESECLLTLFDTMLPPTFPQQSTMWSRLPVGPQHPGTFTSEFGATSFPSFESLAPALGPEAGGSWGLHSKVMAERNHPADSIIASYFGMNERADLSRTGKQSLQRHLYQSMLAQALNIKSVVEKHRAANSFGMLTWQLGEVWPTGGWGVMEYGSVGQPGQLPGGRWKPLLYMMKDSFYADVFAACGNTSTSTSTSGSGGGGGSGDVVANVPSASCYVKNDGVVPFDGHLVVDAISLATGAVEVLHSQTLAMPRGAGVIERFVIKALPPRTTHILRATVIAGATASRGGVGGGGGGGGRAQGLSATPIAKVVSENVMLFASPFELTLPSAKVSWTVAVVGGGSASGGAKKATIHLAASNAPALFVVLTTAAPGRFSKNAFLLVPGLMEEIEFLPWGVLDEEVLKGSLRLEHLAENCCH